MEENEYKKEKKSKVKKKKKDKLLFAYSKHLFFTLALFVIFIIGLSIAFYAYLKSLDEKVKVPRLQGLSLVDAIKQLQDKDLRPYIRTQPSSDVPMFYIISQQTAPNFLVRRKREIAFTVSIGPNWMQMPNFRGKNIYDVKAVIKALPKDKKNLTIRRIYWIPSYKPMGTIINQHPRWGWITKRKVRLTFWVSFQRPIRMPNIKNLYLEEALHYLNRFDLKYKIMLKNVSNKNKDGRVLSQSPFPRKRIERESTVRLIVGQLKNKKSTLAKIHYKVPGKFNRHRLKMVYIDNRGRKILFEGVVYIGDSIIRTVRVFGRPKCYVYQLRGRREKFVKELKL